MNKSKQKKWGKPFFCRMCQKILVYCRQFVVENLFTPPPAAGGAKSLLGFVGKWPFHWVFDILLIYYYGGDILHDSHIFTKHIILSLEDSHLHTFQEYYHIIFDRHYIIFVSGGHEVVTLSDYKRNCSGIVLYCIVLFRVFYIFLRYAV